MRIWIWSLLLASAGTSAQPAPAPAGLRDPMQPPLARRSVTGATAAAAAAETAAAALPAVRHLLVVGEQRWVVQGGRKYGVGDRLGTARIERIEDSAVVVRVGTTPQRLPLYPGVTKQATPVPTASDADSAATTSSTRTAPATPGGADRPAR